MEIKAEVKSITKLKDYFFLVPDYQREYVWQPDDQVEQFIMDIDNEYEANTSLQKSYFIGSIIIVENNGTWQMISEFALGVWKYANVTSVLPTIPHS